MSSVAFAYDNPIVRWILVKFSFSYIVDALEVFFGTFIKDHLTGTCLTNDIRNQSLGTIVQCLCFQIIPSKESELPNSSTAVGEEQEILVNKKSVPANVTPFFRFLDPLSEKPCQFSPLNKSERRSAVLI